MILHPHREVISRDARIIDQNVRPPRFFREAIDQRVTGSGVGHVEHHAPATVGCERSADIGRACLGGGRTNNNGPARREFECDGTANAARSPGHKRDLVLEFHARHL